MPQACGILLPWPGIEPVAPAVEAWSLNHWTARKSLIFLYCVVTWLQTLLRAMKEKRGGCDRRALLDLNRKDALRRNFHDKLVPGKRRRKPIWTMAGSVCHSTSSHQRGSLYHGHRDLWQGPGPARPSPGELMAKFSGMLWASYILWPWLMIKLYGNICPKLYFLSSLLFPYTR